MPAMPQQRPGLRPLAAAALLAALAGCTSVDNYSRSLVNAITPHKVEVVQGNFVSREQVEALQKGMNREQVRNILGTPLVTSLFHGDRWDYVFTLRRKGVEAQKRHLSVFFKDDLMDRVEGDTMPSESEFVTTLDTRRKGQGAPPGGDAGGAQGLPGQEPRHGGVRTGAGRDHRAPRHQLSAARVGAAVRAEWGRARRL